MYAPYLISNLKDKNKWKVKNSKMSGRVKKPAAPKKKVNGYKMPAPIQQGEVIHDTICKKKWRIGPPIGAGGFGVIYSACDHEKSPTNGTPNYPFVIKIEPHENGPLFVEKHFYVRNATQEEITKFMKGQKLQSFGMPTYFGNGSHDYKGEKLRYLVLERYGQDIWSIFKDNGRKFPTTTVFLLGLQMLEVLEYIHSRGYVHADLKGANILLGLKKGTENQAYLVDFGLATRVNDKEFKPDPKCAHNGTIEYTSRDAHLGVPTMRGDLEILAYNMLQWIVGELPWEKSLTNPKTVQDMKEKFMKSAKSNIAKDYKTVPESLVKFIEYINTLKPKDMPDYSKCRQMFESYLKTEGKSRTSKLEFKRIDTKTNKSNETKPRRGRPAKVDSITSDADYPDISTPSEIDKEQKRGTKRKSPKKLIKVDSVTSDTDNTEFSTPSEIEKRQKRLAKTKSPRKPTKVDSVTSDTDNTELSILSETEKEQKRGTKRKSPKKTIKVDSVTSDTDNTELSFPSETEKEQKRGTRRKSPRKPTKVDSVTSDTENLTPNEKDKKQTNRVAKRKSPATPAETIKKTKQIKATPPAKKNHSNMATQTSVEKLRYPRQVTFDSPICEIIGDKKLDSSGDIFDDSFTLDGKKKGKKKRVSDEDFTLTRVTKKKVVVKSRSWKDAPTVVNGRVPPS